VYFRNRKKGPVWPALEVGEGEKISFILPAGFEADDRSTRSMQLSLSAARALADTGGGIFAELSL
jgi:hypothetical protein